MNANNQTLCLNMIVKNEAPVIRRCLDSVLPFIDRWVIVDTGSTDGTQDIIREHLRNVPGEMYERPWRNFAANRTEALELARGQGDYLFVIDADEILEVENGFTLPLLTADSYLVEVLYGGCAYVRKQIVKSTLPWRYTGVLHEYIYCDELHTEETLHGIRTAPRHDGARARDPHTYRRDALTLETALIDEPDNARYVFYLAQSYRDAGDLELAVRHYRRRAEMGGWPEEVWFSLYQIANLRERLGHPWPEVMQDYLAAYSFRSRRAGPLYRIGMHYQALGDYPLAHLFFTRAAEIPYPAGDRLFVERALYDYLLPIELAVSSFYVGDHDTAIETNNALLRSRRVPPEACERVINNRRYSLDARFPAKEAANAGAIHVIVPFRDPGADLDECIDSLAKQTESFHAHFVDDASTISAADRIPAEPRFTFTRHDPAIGVDAIVEDVCANCDDDDVVFMLPASSSLAGADVLTRLRARFNDPDCMLAYGQYRTQFGALGDAEPAASERAHRERGLASAARSSIAFRVALLRETRALAVDLPLAEKLWQCAGYGRTRFLDDIVTIVSDIRPRRVPKQRHSETLPQISCLLVTRDRLALAKRSIRSFADQTYPNRELVIITDGEPWYTNALRRCVEESGIERAQLIVAEDGASLGSLRNRSIDAASGEVVCQWDDDDCSHPDRLMIQAEELFRTNARACFMTDHLQLLEAERMLFMIDWTAGREVTNENQFHPGTIMMFKDRRFTYPEDGAFARRGEDSALVSQIVKHVPIALLSGRGYLYLYQYHGRNTFDREHHVHMSDYCVPAAVIHQHADQIRGAAAYYEMPRPVMVCAAEGPLFAVS